MGNIIETILFEKMANSNHDDAWHSTLRPRGNDDGLKKGAPAQVIGFASVRLGGESQPHHLAIKRGKRNGST